MSKLGSFFRDFLTPFLVLIMAGVVVYDHSLLGERTGAQANVNGKSLGRRFAASLGSSFGDAWLAGADALDQGKSMGDAQAAMQANWQAGRGKAFATQVAPEFAKVLDEGAEPTDPTQRAAVVKLWRDFAAGLKGGR